jgi:hypothetical protein
MPLPDARQNGRDDPEMRKQIENDPNLKKVFEELDRLNDPVRPRPGFPRPEDLPPQKAPRDGR